MPALLRAVLFASVADSLFIAESDLPAFFSAFFMVASRVDLVAPEALALPILEEPLAAGFSALRGFPLASFGLFVPDPAMGAIPEPAAPGMAAPLRAPPAAGGLPELMGAPEASFGLFVPEPAIPGVAPGAVAPVWACTTPPRANEAAIAAAMDMDFKDNLFNMLSPLPVRVVKHKARCLACRH